MNVYIEGPDATGKTTLANWLADEFGFYTVHLTADTPNTFDYHIELMKTDGCAYDRFCLGEVVYSDLYGRVPKLNLDDCVHILQKAQEQKDIFIVLCTSKIDILKDRLKDRGEFKYLDEIEEQNRRYIMLAYALQAVEYEHFYVFDIADGYENIYNTLKEVLDNEL